MARKQVTDMSAWPALSLEGNLIAPAMVAKIDRREAAEQTEDDYEVRKGLTIREEISLAFRVGQAHFDGFTKIDTPSAEATRRFAHDFLKETFGFADLTDTSGMVTCIAGGQRVPIIVVPPLESLERRSPTLSTDRSRSPMFSLQDYLNEHDEALWGLATNGVYLRLLRDNASLTRPAHIEADLSQIFANEDAASFAALWLLIHRSRFGEAGTPATDCALERWRETGAREGEAARDRLAGQVEVALRVLGSSFLDVNPSLAARLQSGALSLTVWFNELLRLVYRLIFLMVAEDRNLLHPTNAKRDARTLYIDGYGLAMLRAHCVRGATWDRHYDRYEGMKVVFRALATGEDALALPALGGLFGADQLPHLASARLRNSAFMEAVYRLSWLSDQSGMVPVNWRAMETEELGSVYESLLELQPQLTNDGRALVFASDVSEQKGNQRKTTGSYYTPDSLVQALLDTALDPVLERIEAEAKDPAKTLLRLSVIDPACGSGHFLLAAARRIATRLARIRAEGTPSLADFRHALRDVARCCIHGVDRNPMAVELTKVALWIETVDPGLPLGFFDAQVRCGDALLGIFDLKVLEDGIPDAAYKPLTGDDKVTAKYYLRANRDATAGQGEFDFGTGRAVLPAIRPLAGDFSGFRNLPEDTVEQIGVKATRFQELREKEAFACARAASDLYVGAFLLPKIGGAPLSTKARTVPTTDEVWLALSQGMIRQSMTGAPEAARQARAFHWPLEFPDIMARGGFDVVLGNPPWERIKLQEQEFFAARSPEIAGAQNKAARARLIKALEIAPKDSTEHALHAAFIDAKHQAEATSEFVRVSDDEGGRFVLTGRGDVNTYSLFAETFLRLINKKGRAGLIVPTGICTDNTTRVFFEEISTKGRLVSLFSFENEEFIFRSVHHSFRFCLLTLQGELGTTKQSEFVFFARQPDAIQDLDRCFTLSPDDILRINPNTKTAPVFRSKADAELTKKIYANAPILIDESKGKEGNPWGVSFMAMFHMSNDSGLFRTARQLAEVGFVREGTDWVRSDQCPSQGAQAGDGIDGGSLPLADSGMGITRYVPLYEAKMIHQFDHRWAGYDEDGESSADLGQTEKQNPTCEPVPRYWVPETELDERLTAKGWSRGWLMGWRDITSAHVLRTVIATVFPRVGVGNKIPLFFPNTTPHNAAGFAANLSALVFDFASRQKIGGTTLNFFIVHQLPILPPTFYTEHHLAFLVPKVLELIYTSHALAPFARDLGYDGPPFAWDEKRRAYLRADLDAFYARAYGLTRDELRYILDPADVKGPDYPSETFRVLKEKEVRQYGEYLTRRLVLAAWDQMEVSGQFTGLGL